MSNVERSDMERIEDPTLKMHFSGFIKEKELKFTSGKKI